MIPAIRVEEAGRRIGRLINRTPITYDPSLKLFLKWENQQFTGSFKIRGALNKVMSLDRAEIERGLVTCSAGNHGQGVAVAAGRVGANCLVFASDHATPVKLAAMRKLGAEVKLVSGGYVEAEKAAIAYAGETGRVFVSPYNDLVVIAGQGTVGLEIQEFFQGSEYPGRLLIPVGGGGLLSGIAAYLRSLENCPKIIGIQSVSSSYAYQLFHTGSQIGVMEEESIADGLAGEIDHNSITIPMLRECMDDILLVNEDEIKDAIRYAWNVHQQKIEGSAAVGLAAQLAGKIHISPALTVITGGNIQPELFDSIIRRNK